MFGFDRDFATDALESKTWPEGTVRRTSSPDERCTKRSIITMRNCSITRGAFRLSNPATSWLLLVFPTVVVDTTISDRTFRGWLHSGERPAGWSHTERGQHRQL